MLTDASMVMLQLEMYQPQHQSGTAAVQVLYTTSGQPVTFTVASNIYESYKTRQSMIAGLVLVISGVLSVVFNSVGISSLESLSIIGHGIWCGVVVSNICFWECLLPKEQTRFLFTCLFSFLYQLSGYQVIKMLPHNVTVAWIQETRLSLTIWQTTRCIVQYGMAWLPSKIHTIPCVATPNSVVLHQRVST